MERKEAIRGAYRMTGGNSFYDGMITCSTLSGKAVCRSVWAMNKAENDAYLEKAMSGIPEHFSGKPIYYEFTSCLAAEFAIRHGLTDIMPALCNVDYASMELLHAKLIRATTCVNGYRCDYTICGDKDPYVKEHPEYRDEAGFRRNKQQFTQRGVR